MLLLATSAAIAACRAAPPPVPSTRAAEARPSPVTQTPVPGRSAPPTRFDIAESAKYSLHSLPSKGPLALAYTYPNHRHPASLVRTASALLEPLRVDFSRVKLPKTSPIRYISGTGPQDVWLIDEMAKAYTFDGKKVRSRGKICFFGNRPEDEVIVLKNDFLITGEYFTGGPEGHAAVVCSRDMRCKCEYRRVGDPLMPVAAAADDIWIVGNGSIDSRKNGSISTAGFSEGPLALWVGSAQWAWAAVAICDRAGHPCYSEIWEYRGLTFQPRPPVDLRATRIWADDTDRLWLLGTANDNDDPVVAVFEGEVWQRLTVPPTFRGTTKILGRGQAEVWFYGPEHLFLSNGMSLREVTTPLTKISAAWLEPGGSLWIAGSMGADDEQSVAVWRSQGVAR